MKNTFIRYAVLTIIISTGAMFGTNHDSQEIGIYARNRSSGAYDVTMTIIRLVDGWKLTEKAIEIDKSGKAKKVGTVAPGGFVQYKYFGRFKNWATKTYSWDDLRAIAGDKPSVLFTYNRLYWTTVSPYDVDRQEAQTTDENENDSNNNDDSDDRGTDYGQAQTTDGSDADSNRFTSESENGDSDSEFMSAESGEEWIDLPI